MRRDVPFVETLTPLRGIAAMMVVLLHFSDGLFPAIETTAITQFILKGYLWVDFFFVLSGFVITHVYHDWFERGAGTDGDRAHYRRFIYARISKIYPVHVVVLFGFLLLEFAKLALLSGGASGLTEAFTGDKAPVGFVTSLLLIQSLGIHDQVMWNLPAWSMSVEWATYFLFPVLALVFLKPGRIFIVPMMLLLFGGLFALCALRGHLNVITDYGILRCLLSFSIGMLIWRVYHDGTVADLFARSWLFVVAAAGAVAVLHFGWFEALAIPFFALMILTAARNRGMVHRVLTVRPLVFLGDVSYSLYMTHFLVREAGARAFRVVMGQNLWDMPWTVWQSSAAIALSILLCVLVAWLSYRIVERPVQRALRKARFAP